VAPSPVATELPASAESVPHARELATRVAAELMDEDQLSKLHLVVSELVSNAVRHSRASDPVRVAMTPKDDFLCVQVTDGGQGLVPRPGAISTEPGAGYGLFLVEQLTRRWGMTREQGRTRVWLEIDFEPSDDEGNDEGPGATGPSDRRASPAPR
jgi:anti-sigma regulatory factor (Ser/Thr protein kinase)